MKITLNMMDLADISYSWKTIYTALLHDFIEVSEVEKYAFKVIESINYEDNEFINDLVWGGKEKEEIVNNMLEEKLVTNVICFEEFELSKIKYTILFYLKNRYEGSNEELLRSIELVYADFGYPNDMSTFIYYMPTNDKIASTKEEREINMISKFNKYLIQLKNYIDINDIMERTI